MEGKVENVEQVKKYALIVYILYAASFLIGLTAIAGVIVAYLKKKEAVGTWVESHFDYQIRTFWVSFIAGVVGFVLSFIFVGTIILLADLLWFLYRTVKGMLALNDNKSVDPYSWF